jgi:hypothetical protein
MAFGKKSVELSIPPLAIQKMRLRLVGTSPLVTHAWSAKAQNMMAEAQGGKPKQGGKKKDPRDPFLDYVDAIYFTAEEAETIFTRENGEQIVRRGRPGFPARAIKASAVEASKAVGQFKTDMKSAFFIEGDILPILGDAPVMRTDPVRLQTGVASLAYRPEFKRWAIDLVIVFNASVIRPEHVVNLLNTAGFAVGIGEGRMKSRESCGMGWGSFTIGEHLELLESTSPTPQLPPDGADGLAA